MLLLGTDILHVFSKAFLVPLGGGETDGRSAKHFWIFRFASLAQHVNVRL